jgi:hypothetical protein
MSLLEIGMSILMCLGIVAPQHQPQSQRPAQIVSQSEVRTEELIEQVMQRIEESIDSKFGEGTFDDIQNGNVEITDD